MIDGLSFATEGSKYIQKDRHPHHYIPFCKWGIKTIPCTMAEIVLLLFVINITLKLIVYNKMGGDLTTVFSSLVYY